MGRNPSLYEHEDDDLRILFQEEHCAAIVGRRDAVEGFYTRQSK